MVNPFGVVAAHAGGGPGYATAAYHFPDVHGCQVSSVALVNRDGTDAAAAIIFAIVQHNASEMGQASQAENRLAGQDVPARSRLRTSRRKRIVSSSTVAGSESSQP